MGIHASQRIMDGQESHVIKGNHSELCLCELPSHFHYFISNHEGFLGHSYRWITLPCSPASSIGLELEYKILPCINSDCTIHTFQTSNSIHLENSEILRQYTFIFYSCNVILAFSAAKKYNFCYCYYYCFIISLVTVLLDLEAQYSLAIKHFAYILRNSLKELDWYRAEWNTTSKHIQIDCTFPYVSSHFCSTKAEFVGKKNIFYRIL